MFWDNNLDKYCYIQLTGLTTYQFLDILNYKSWKYKTYQKTVIIRHVDLLKTMRHGDTTIRTTIEFAPLLLRHLREKKIQYSTFKMMKCREMNNINNIIDDIIYEKVEKGEKKDNRKWVGYHGKIVEIKASGGNKA